MKSFPLGKKKEEDKAKDLKAQRKANALVKRMKAPVEKVTLPAPPPTCRLSYATWSDCNESKKDYSASAKCGLCDRGGMRV